ncbi:DUF1376 domain-containing protein [Tenacibaculum maritimum]|uniref:DUF1376 domain-containing protein n=1 Tax=Tenacibaculum maritimum TaxID=107401 RepID=UPI00388FF66A
MSKDPALMVYTKDFLEGTADLSVEEFGAFTRLIFHQHQRGFLPKNLKKLARLSGVSYSEFEEIWGEISAKFTLSDSGYVNKRCAEEISKRSQNSVKKSIIAVFGNWVKANSHLSKALVSKIKKSFSIEDFLKIDNEEERKNKILEVLRKLSEANAKRSPPNVNVNVNANVNVNKDEDEDEDEKINLVLPFDTEAFKVQWELWKTFKQKEFKFSYKSEISEQSALKNLSELSKLNEKTAIAIIHQSIENGWKGLFELKKQSNNGKYSKKEVQYSENFKRGIFEKLQSR